ncbi:heat shock protein beta-6 [Erpetoichthys calabaricus]|uniref:Heat shock protein, alpha-crystallin-related, b6 n=1 Tax=Erpetoichthys calabaricus TaxID=27687 RepID=A0A8C4XEE5_ERPCA|nr:heat shock protein beta-6 [Erpetoichthys calabaricus]
MERVPSSFFSSPWPGQGLVTHSWPWVTGQLGQYSWTPISFNIPSTVHSGAAKAQMETDSFTISMDVRHFEPDQLSVKVSRDFVEVHGRHEQKKDQHGLVSREFQTRHRIPKGAAVSAISSSLSSEGILRVIIPLLNSKSQNEHLVPISVGQDMLEKIRVQTKDREAIYVQDKLSLK